MLLLLKRNFLSMLREGKKNGAEKFSPWLFFRETVSKHFSLFLYFLICLLTFIAFCDEYPRGANLLFIVFCVSGWMCTVPWEKKTIASSLILLTVLDYHFSVHYGRVFYEIGSQALVALHITDGDEITAYLRGLFPSEVIFYIFLILSLIIFLCTKTPNRLCKGIYGRVLPYAIFLFGFYHIIILPYKEFAADWKERGAILRKREIFSFHAEDKRPGTRQLIFLIIGETHRHDHIDLLTDEKFAPTLRLLRSQGKILMLDDIITCYQTTYFSISSLLTRRKTDDQKRFFPEKGLIDLYKEAGYHTVFITYTPPSLESDVFNITLRAADEHINYRDYGKGRLDRLMIPICRRISRNYRHEKLLVVVKMIGAHFHYQDRYTQETMIHHPSFQPGSDVGSYDISMKEKIRNSYKNAVLESSVFLNGVAETVSEAAAPAMMFFISDHGCTNYDDGKNPFIGGAPENYHVPCFFYFNDSFLKLFPRQMYANLKKNAGASVTNSCIFDTIVSLSGIDYPARRPSMDLTSPSFKEDRDRHVWLWNSRVPYRTLFGEKRDR